MKRETAEITTESIQLDQFIKWIGISETGGQARFLVDEGNVSVNGVRVTERRKKLFPGDCIVIEGTEYLVKQVDETGL